MTIEAKGHAYGVGVFSAKRPLQLRRHDPGHEPDSERSHTLPAVTVDTEQRLVVRPCVANRCRAPAGSRRRRVRRSPADVRELDARAGRLACVLRDAGVGPDHKVAIMCVNSPEYLEAFYAAQKLGAVPVNVNYRYVGAELAYLLDNSDAVALVFHDDFAPTVDDALATLPDGRRPQFLLAGRARRRRQAARRARSTTKLAIAAAPDDAADRPTRRRRRPRLPLHRRHDRQPEGRDVAQRRPVRRRSGRWRGPGTQPPDVGRDARAGKRAATCLPACPLMHGTGLFIALVDARRRRHRRAARHAAARRRRGVGRDRARARAGVHDRRRRVRASAARRARRGAPSDGTSPACARSRRRASRGARRRSAGCSHTSRTCTLIDSLGASEGIMTRTETRDGDDIAPARFKASERVVVVTDDGGVVHPGDGEVGMLGVGGAIPLGYYKDPEKTAATFRTVGGRRYSIPGRLRDGRRRRHDPAARPRVGVHQHRRREGVPRRGRARAARPRRRVRLRRGRRPRRPLGRDGGRARATLETGTRSTPMRWPQHCRDVARGVQGARSEFVVVDSLERSPAGKADYKHLREVAAFPSPNRGTPVSEVPT